MRTNLTSFFRKLDNDLVQALGELSYDIADPAEANRVEELKLFHKWLSKFARDAETLNKEWKRLSGNKKHPIPKPDPVTVSKPEPEPEPDSEQLYLGKWVGKGRTQNAQVLYLIQTVGAARVHAICKKHNILAAPRKAPYLFIDDKPYEIAQPAKPVQGEDGKTYYVYCCLNVGQKQKRLDAIAKWL